MSVPNLASRVLARCAKHVPQDWQQRFGYAPLLLETFGDPVSHRGTCYQAAGWTTVGTSRGFRRDGPEFQVADSHAKEVWVKPLQPQARAWLRSEPLPSPWAAYEKELPATQVAARLGAAGLRSLDDRFRDLRDPRRPQGRRYRLATGMAILFCAVLSGAKGLTVCAEFAAQLSQTQLASLRSWRQPWRRGQPLADTTSTALDVASFPVTTPKPEQVQALLRGHWGIEHGLHHRQDRSLDEDRNRAAATGSGRVFCVLRSLTALIFGRAKLSLSVLQRRFTAKPAKLLKLLFAPSLSFWERTYRPYPLRSV